MGNAYDGWTGASNTTADQHDPADTDSHDQWSWMPQRWLLLLAERLIRRGLETTLTRPTDAPWKLNVRTPAPGRRRLRRTQPSLIVYCGGAEDAYVFVTGAGRIIAAADHVEAAADEIAQILTGKRRAKV